MEPDTSTSWTVKAKYKSKNVGTDCNCTDEVYEATLDVKWDNGTGNFIRENEDGEDVSPFIDIDVCGSDICGAVVNGYGYKLAVDVLHTVWINCPIDGLVPHFLDQVLYTTTAIDDGYPLQGEPCTQQLTSVSPVTQTVQQGDNGAWVCDNNSCPTGVSVQIKYN